MNTVALTDGSWKVHEHANLIAKFILSNLSRTLDNYRYFIVIPFWKYLLRSYILTVNARKHRFRGNFCKVFNFYRASFFVLILFHSNVNYFNRKPLKA